MSNDFVLILILTLLTFNFLFVSTIVILLLRDVRKALQKLSMILEDVHSFTEVAAKPAGILLTLVSGLIGGMKTFNTMKDSRHSSDRRKED